MFQHLGRVHKSFCASLLCLIAISTSSALGQIWYSPSYVSIPGTNATRVIVADFRGNGHKADVLTVLDSHLLAFGQDASGHLHALPQKSPSYVIDATAADFDHDGKTDLLFMGSESEGVGTGLYLLPGKGDGSFGAAKAIDLPPGFTLDDSCRIEAGHFSPKIPDVWDVALSCSAQSADLMIGTNDGTGHFAFGKRFRVASAGRRLMGFSVGDVNGDGVDDLLISTSLVSDPNSKSQDLLIYDDVSGYTSTKALSSADSVHLADYDGDSLAGWFSVQGSSIQSQRGSKMGEGRVDPVVSAQPGCQIRAVTSGNLSGQARSLAEDMVFVEDCEGQGLSLGVVRNLARTSLELHASPKFEDGKYRVEIVVATHSAYARKTPRGSIILGYGQNQTISAKLVDGTAKFHVRLDKGKNWITALYQGDEYFAASTGMESLDLVDHDGESDFPDVARNFSGVTPQFVSWHPRQQGFFYPALTTANALTPFVKSPYVVSQPFDAVTRLSSAVQIPTANTPYYLESYAELLPDGRPMPTGSFAFSATGATLGSPTTTIVATFKESVGSDCDCTESVEVDQLYADAPVSFSAAGTSQLAVAFDSPFGSRTASGSTTVRGIDAIASSVVSPQTAMTSQSFVSPTRAFAAPAVKPLVIAPSVGPGIVNTIAGTGGAGNSGYGGAATSAELSLNTQSAIDSSGNIYIADYDSYNVLKVTASTDDVSVIAGSSTMKFGYSGVPGTATSAEFLQVTGVVLDPSGNVYFSDTGNNRIFKLTTSTGNVALLAGNGTAGYSGDGAAATSAELSSPFNLAIDSSQNIYVTDLNNNRIRKINTTTGIITTVAGNGTAGFSGDGGAATGAELNAPRSLFIDSGNNLYITDTNNGRIREVNPTTGIISTVAGGGSATGNGIPALSATLGALTGVVKDSAGNLFYGNLTQTFRMAADSGIQQIVAGNGTSGDSGDGGVATSAEFSGIWGINLDSAGNIYLNDGFNNRLRKVGAKSAPTVAESCTPTSPIYGANVTCTSTVSGTATGSILFSYNGSTSTQLLAGRSASVVAFPSGAAAGIHTVTALYSGDSNNYMDQATTTVTIAKASPSISLSAPNVVDGNPVAITAAMSNGSLATGTVSFQLNGVSIGTAALSNGVASISTSSSTACGNCSVTAAYSGDGNDNVASASTALVISKATPAPTINASSSTSSVTFTAAVPAVGTAAPPTGSVTFFLNGSSIGSATLSGGVANFTQSSLPISSNTAYFTYSGDSNYVSADSNQITLAPIQIPGPGIINTVAGNGTNGTAGYGNIATSAELSTPQGSVLDQNGNLYIFNNGAACNVLKVSAATGLATVYAGSASGQCGYSGDGGQATNATIGAENNGGVNDGPAGLAIDTSGNLYLSDINNARVREVDAASGIISTVAGDGTPNYSGDGAPATSAGIDGPMGVGLDFSGNIYIAGSLENRIRKVASGNISTIAGTGVKGDTGDGNAATGAEVANPSGIAIDAAGDVFFADASDQVIREINASTGVISTVAGGGASSADGSLSTATAIKTAAGIAVDTSGNLFYVDSGLNVVRRVSALSQIVQTVAGTSGTPGFSGDGAAATAADLSGPTGIALDSSANLFIADATNQRIRAVGAKLTPDVTISCSNTTYGSGATLCTATVTSAATGNVLFSFNGTSSTQPLSGGTAALIAGNDVGAGTYTVTALYQGSSSYYMEAASASVTVSQASPDLTLSCSPSTLSYGSGSSTCTATLNSNATGMIQFGYNGQTSTQSIVNGSASFTSFSGFAAGTYPVSATYSGDTNNLSQSASNSVTINKAGTTLSVTCSPSTLTYKGGNSTCTATVTGSEATGTVQFSYAGTTSTQTLSSGTASITAFNGLAAGNYPVSATYSGDSNHSSSTGSADVVIGKAAHGAGYTIGWAAPSAITYGTPLTSIQLNASATIPGSFAYDPAAGTVLPAGTQTLSTTFTPTDSADYSSGAQTTTIVVNKATPAITWGTPAPINYGTPLSAAQLDASSPVAGTFSYSPASGAVLSAGSQTLTVTFTPTDTGDYTTASSTVTLTVNKTTPAITWPAPTAITYGTALSSTQLNASTSIQGSFSYSPVAGAILNAGTQTLSVTFTPTDTSNYTTAISSVSLIVNKATPTIAWATPAPITYGTALSAMQLDASGSVPGSFAYSPAAGTVLGAGTQTLTASFTPTDTNDYNLQTASVSLIVNKATPTLSWASPSAITYGTPLSAAQLDASSSVPGTFVYSPAAGTVLGAGAQTLSVAFTPTDATDYTASSATTSLTVSKATPTLTWATPTAITYGTPLTAAQLNASSSVSGTFAYSPAVGTVLSAGAQILSVAFTPADTADYNAASATVSLTVNKATPAITWSAPAAITYGTPLNPSQLDATASVEGSFAYSPALGTVLTAGHQSLSTVFTPSDTADYTSASSTVPLTVNQATPTLAWSSPSSIVYGTPLSGTQLNATSSVPGSFIYSPAPGAVLSAGTQALAVSFTPSDTTNYTSATATVMLVVSKATPTLSWPAPSAIVFGTPLSGQQLNATSSIQGSFGYSPSVGTVLTAGQQPLSVIFTPSDTTDYNAVSGSAMLTVNKATPSITWASPSAITYGTALSGAQLNAGASVQGTFVYNPAPDAVLNAGTQVLTVSFTPSDTSDYTPLSSTVSLTVNRATPTVTWTTPQAVVYGTPLGATQLNASASVAGSLAYSPSAGAIEPAGTNLLSAVFTPTDLVDYNSVPVTTSLTVTKASSGLSWSPIAPITYGTPLSAMQLNASAFVDGTFTYNPAAGTILGSGTQRISVVFTPASSNYAASTLTNAVVVNRATPTITWTSPASITYGTALSASQLNAIASVPGSFTYSPAEGSVLQAGTQTLSVTFTPSDQDNYTTRSTSVSLIVNKANPTIVWPIAITPPAPLIYGAALGASQLNATANIPGTFTYSPAAGTILPAGQHTITANFTPTSADYGVMTATALLTVDKATPVVTWSPAPVADNSILGPAELNAVASAPGTFTYTPAAGQTVTAGIQTLRAIFTPADSANYAVVSAQASLVVQTPDFSISGPKMAAFDAGDIGSGLVTITPIQGFEGKVSLSCSNVPEMMTCNFENDGISIGPGSSGAASTKIIIGTLGRSIASIGGIFLCGLGFTRRRRRSLLATASLSIALLTGCTIEHYVQKDGVAPGTYSVLVTGTSGTITHAQTIIFTVKQ